MRRSIWEQQSFFHYDYTIVGGGIVGLTAAWYLRQAQPHKSVLVLERGFPPSGASTKNAGFACFGSISELLEQEKKLGFSELQKLIERRWKGLLKLRDLLGDEALDFQQQGGYEIFTEKEQGAPDAGLKDLCFGRLNHFNELVYPIFQEKEIYQVFQDPENQFGFKGITGMIKNRLEGQIDTGKMMFTLIQKVCAVGVTFVPNVIVSELNSLAKEVEINTSIGKFKTGKLLLATNAFTNELVPHQDIHPGRGQVLVTEPIPGLRFKGTFHYDQGYYYFRNLGNRVLFGGGRNLDFKGEETSDFGLTTEIQNKLDSLLKTVILPGIDFKISSRWSGIMAFGQDLNPIIRELAPRIYCAVRSNGMGVAIGAQNGFDLAELALRSD